MSYEFIAKLFLDQFARIVINCETNRIKFKKKY